MLKIKWCINSIHNVIVIFFGKIVDLKEITVCRKGRDRIRYKLMATNDKNHQALWPDPKNTKYSDLALLIYMEDCIDFLQLVILCNK